MSIAGSTTDASPKPSFVADNLGIVFLPFLASIPFFVLCMVVGLNLALATFLLLLFSASAIAIHWWRARRSSTGLGGFGSTTLSGGLATLAVFVAIQLVPFCRAHSNGAVVAGPAWPDAETEALARRACFDCHSNETRYPWYAKIAPLSWLVADHVDKGRAEINFSDLTKGRADPGEVADVIKQDVMPPFYYTVFGLHPEAELSEAERAKLMAALAKMPEFRKARADVAAVAEAPVGLP